MARFLPSLAALKAAFARFSTGTKMLLVMSGALLPLGLIALIGSLQYAHSKRVQHAADARLIAIAEARQIDLVVARAANILRFASGTAPASRARCGLLLAEAARLLPAGTRVALFRADRSLSCATPGFQISNAPPPAQSIGAEIALLGPAGLRFSTRSESGNYAIGELSPDALREAVGTLTSSQGLSLRQDHILLQLAAPDPGGALQRTYAVSTPVGGGQVVLTATTASAAVSGVELLLILVPLLMWAAAATIGWVVVNELLLRPLGRLQRAVATEAATTGHFVMPRLQTPAHEIRTLAEAFAQATAQIAQREGRLEEGLRHQVLLTREVHHRVKNNLQVVASLINLHARGTSGDVAAAYASIQRRVDALAVVHRNHYAELEKHNGVSLRALIAELTANLRATAPASASHFQITLEMAQAHISQDVAVPVAFLITELVEMLMMRSPNDHVRITLASLDPPERAMLTIASAGLSNLGEDNDPGTERYGRIIAGLARQLRTTLAFDATAGTYAISIPVLEEAEDSNPE